MSQNQCVCHDNETPNLQIGVETRRNMRYMGKQVYSRMVNFGSLTNATTKTVPHGIPDVEWIQVDHTYSTVRMPDGTSRAASYSGQAATANKTVVGITPNKDYRTYTATLCVVYTKTTDPVIA